MKNLARKGENERKFSNNDNNVSYFSIYLYRTLIIQLMVLVQYALYKTIRQFAVATIVKVYPFVAE